MASRDGPKRARTRRGLRKWRNLAEPGVETSLASRERPRGWADRSATVMCSVAEPASGPVTLAPYLLKLFTFRLDFTDNPYGIKIFGLRISNRMIELY